MDIVTVEVDIAADGSITAAPNPVKVRSGQTLYLHVRSNASEASKFTMHFPGGAQSPFGARDTEVTVNAIRCVGGGHHVQWPPAVSRTKVGLSAHGSPVFGRAVLTVVDESVADTGSFVSDRLPASIVQHYYVGSVPIAMVPGDPTPLEKDDGAVRTSTDCGPPKVSAGPIWGPWSDNPKEAFSNALSLVREACRSQCSGNCGGKTCAYLEAESSFSDLEERPNPAVNGNPQFRAKALSSGACQCE